MPFGFLRRGRDSDDRPSAGDAERGGGGVPFEALTEEWHLRGVMEIETRMMDALNRREPIGITDVAWGPLEPGAQLEPAPGLRTVDPYDLIVVLSGDGTAPPLSDAERAAHRVHKVSYDVALELPPFRVIGTVWLYPGSEPERLLDRATEMFIPVTDASVSMAGTALTSTDAEAVLVNRFYLRGVDQVDRRTGERPQRLPGMPLGGVSWQDRSR